VSETGPWTHVHHAEWYLARLTRELEKKFADMHVVFVAQRRTLAKPTRTSRVKQKRPRSRTLTDVHDKILEDLVYPTEIVGKRTKVATDGSKLLKVSVVLSCPIATAYIHPITQVSGFERLQLTGVQARLLLVSLPQVNRQGGHLRVPCRCCRMIFLTHCMANPYDLGVLSTK
jgi:Ribosomal protein S7e